MIRLNLNLFIPNKYVELNPDSHWAHFSPI